MESSLVCISGVRGYEKNGVAYLHIEDVARGLGLTQSQVKNGKEYTSIRWERIDAFLADFGFPPQVGESGNSHDLSFCHKWQKTKTDVFRGLIKQKRAAETPHLKPPIVVTTTPMA